MTFDDSVQGKWSGRLVDVRGFDFRRNHNFPFLKRSATSLLPSANSQTIGVLLKIAFRQPFY